MRILTPALLTLLMLFVIGGLVIFYLFKSFFWVEPEPERAATTRLVPMAAGDIPAGTLITSEHVVTGRLDESKLERDTILNRDTVVGRYALEDITQAQPFRTAQLYAPNTRPPLEINPGMRAVTIGLGNSTDLVDGLIKPEDFVDVHLSIADNGADRRYRGGFTMTMFKGVRVLAINRMTQQTDLSRGSNTITFELSPEQSNILLEAKKHGEIVVTYTPNGPGSGGVDVAEADRAYFDEILGLPEPPEAEKPFLTEIWRGSARSVIDYGDERDDWDNDWDGATPWIETPGWAPPRNNGNYGRGYGRGYGGRGWGGYRGTQVSPPTSDNPEFQGNPNAAPSPNSRGRFNSAT
ncbi:Flp pilus assembly protein CpaB [Rubinisphaera margarita]|uniref:Flp pilus assembly protein CpaB n=1 Tax=Rubinisphaera margarita TaxID=2909586 RepID=UPI001EE8F6D0|nr:Flp pilus assembly protein CpaB [Rubinisphaera margarita]MCG6156798.1 Flp pilus assembly protein CpaB [Rubinisphaera margarita]